MLVPGFYTIDSIEEIDGGIVGHIKLDPAHDLYKGHFPDQPVVPGVMQLQIVKEIFEKYLGKNLSIKKVRQIKYMIPIIPDDYHRLSFELKFKNTSTIVFQITSGDALFSKGSVELV